LDDRTQENLIKERAEETEAAGENPAVSVFFSTVL
jgi:hypothetical protein